MSRGKRLEIELKPRDRQQVEKLLGGGLQAVRTTLRALALLQLDQGQSTPAVGANLGLSAKAVWQIGKRYLDGGLERAVFDAARPGKAPALDQQQQQRIIAVVCSPPPEGRARWTVRLLTEEVIKRKLVPARGQRDHSNSCWKATTSSHGGKKMWCVGELDEEYIFKMEDVLKTYEKPLSEREPVVCVDEKPVVLHEDTRPSIPMGPGQVARRDYEYERCGTANVFCGIEPKAGVHFTKVTPTRSSPEFADFLLSIAEHYPAAHTIHLVMDNLSTHTRKALVDRFGEEDGGWLWERFTVHYTPKHGSWLNQAEIEIGLFSRQCLGKR